ncbi:hypothetical protein RHGRI_000030 [Rhododendron griersonianum]|uniref:Uncharacterized protein n=1 Tax=Rhododendron griersonianum TaxID=479676 RepID=A0AAV6LG54_9ERIC|nr:hypothetical protein RHGRI_000030 [Rhododendron griersonianum]
MSLLAQNKEENVGAQTGSELLPEHPNLGATATATGKPQEAPPTQPTTTAAFTPTTQQTLTALFRSPPPKPPDLGETQTSTARI